MPRSVALLVLGLAAAASACGDDGACGAGEVECAGDCRGAAFFAAARDHCGACGVSCGTGTCAGGVCDCGTAASCAGGGCVIEHANGLGQSYSDCQPLDMHTRAQAELAAAAWNPAGSIHHAGRCPVGCLCTERGNEAAVWCHVGSDRRSGWVLATSGADCATAFCPDRGLGRAWH